MYGKATTLVGQAHERLQLADYMRKSLDTFDQDSIWGKLLYREDIPAVDPLTGAAYKKTIRFAKPQGPGGVAGFSENMLQNVLQPGNIGMMIPTGEQLTLGTQFKYTTIGRTWQDALVDQQGLYEAIVEAQMGEQITRALDEMTKSAIYAASEKIAPLAAPSGADAGAVSTADMDAWKLTWADVKELVKRKETYVVQMRNNHERANSAFVNAVAGLTDITSNQPGNPESGATAGSGPAVYGLPDFEAYAAAQQEFANKWRSERWATPRYIITASTDIRHYTSEFVKLDSINISLPSYKTLYSKEFVNQQSPMLVILGNSGYRQLFEDEQFLAAIQVSGYKHEEGLSGRVQTFIPHEQAINVQGILIMNVQQRELKYTDFTTDAILDGGVSFGDSINANGVSFSTAFTAVPGFNFITRATEGIGSNGIRTMSKKFTDNDMIDRFGFHEYTNMLFAWDVSILDPTAFALVYHAES